jgi:hypothetical protein
LCVRPDPFPHDAIARCWGCMRRAACVRPTPLVIVQSTSNAAATRAMLRTVGRAIKRWRLGPLEIAKSSQPWSAENTWDPQENKLVPGDPTSRSLKILARASRARRIGPRRCCKSTRSSWNRAPCMTGHARCTSRQYVTVGGNIAPGRSAGQARNSHESLALCVQVRPTLSPDPCPGPRQRASENSESSREKGGGTMLRPPRKFRAPAPRECSERKWEFASSRNRTV